MTTAAIQQRPTASAELQAAMIEFERLDNLIATREEELKDLKAQRKELGESHITDLVTAEGVLHSGVRFSDGTEYTFERVVRCGIKTDDKPAAFAWLTEHKADGMIKHHLVLSFGTNSTKRVMEVRALLARLLPEYEVGIKVGKAPEELVGAVTTLLTTAGFIPGIEISEEREVNGSTLAAFVRKSLKTGTNLPPEFGVYAPLVGIKVPAPKTE